MTAAGTLYGVGLGPGDPDLVTIKAQRVAVHCPVIAYFRKRGRPGHARSILDAIVPCAAKIEVALEYPVTTEVAFTEAAYVEPMRAFYAASAAALRDHLDAGRDVALLCEGDPLFYGSFLHMYERLRSAYRVTIIPGISGMSGCWTAAATPIACGDDVLTVVPGTLSPGALFERLSTADAAVIMKVGRNLPKIKTALDRAGRLAEAIYVERGTMEGERVLALKDIATNDAPYFSIVLVPGGRGRRIA